MHSGTIVAKWRLAVLAVATATTALKLTVAATTFGTNDVESWQSFAAGVRAYGPVGLYGHEFYSQYNHPPLSGWMLLVINWCVEHGVAGLPFLIRVPASVADLVTGLLVFELVRRYRSPRAAAVAAGLLVASPALVVVSGFHGNTDPLFVMFGLLSVYLVCTPTATSRWATLSAAAGGAAFIAAISVKLVPVVLGPVLLVALIRRGRRQVGAFAAGALALFVPLWMPVLATRWAAFNADVLSYPGVTPRQWGLEQFATWLDAPQSVADALVTPGRFVVLLVSALVPAALLWRDRLSLAPAAGLALSLFLLLSPAFGMQYLVWPLAGVYLISGWAATVYSAAIALFTIQVYDDWNHAHPWNWDVASAHVMRPKDLVLMTLAWCALALVAAVGLSRRQVPARAVPMRPEAVIDVPLDSAELTAAGDLVTQGAAE